ncbi:MAG: phenylphosphate carboxylase subunit gamma [Thermodesulfobacteriota bacterium]
MVRAKKEYQVYVPSIQEGLPEGREIVLTVKDLTPGRRKYDNKVVKAIVSRSADSLPDSDVLRVRSWMGVLYPDPWAIRIIEEVGELIPGVPHGETLLRQKG